MKTRTFTRIISLITVFVLVFALSVTAFAAGDDGDEDDGGDFGIMTLSLSIETETANSFKAYKLLNLVTGLRTHEGDEFDHTEGDTDKHTESCYSFNYTVNEKYRSALQTVIASMKPELGDADSISDAQILSYLSSDEFSKNSSKVRTFADQIYQTIKRESPDFTTTDGNFGEIDQGYYLIAETSTLLTDDARSLVMLDTHGQLDVVVHPKEDVPTIDKKVKDDGVWTSHADIKVGEDAEFQLTGTLPDNYTNFDVYQYIFHDTLSEGLTLKKDSITVTIDGEEVDAGLYTVNTAEEGTATDGCTFEIVFNDMTDAQWDEFAITGGKEGSKIVVTYSATVNKETVTFGNDGNPNDVHLEYSNDPYEETTGNTTVKHAVVFSFQLVVNKVDERGYGLKGAMFKVQKWDDDSDGWIDYLNPNEDSTSSKFTFDGLVEGKYKLVETKVPDGYVKADDIEFSVVATYGDNDTDGKDEVLTLVVNDKNGSAASGVVDATFEIDSQLGTMTTSIENVTGNRLPSTGGIGVYVVYALGGLIVMIGLAFVAKSKRTSAE